MSEIEVIWSVRKLATGKVDLEFGPTLSEAPFEDDAKLRVVGEALIKIGTQLMTSTVREDDEDEWDDDEDDES